MKVIYEAKNLQGAQLEECKHLLFWIEDSAVNYIDKYLMQGCPGNKGTYDHRTIEIFKSTVFDEY